MRYTSLVIAFALATTPALASDGLAPEAKSHAVISGAGSRADDIIRQRAETEEMAGDDAPAGTPEGQPWMACDLSGCP